METVSTSDRRADSRRFGAMDAAAAAGLAAVVLVLYGRSLRFWWTADDPAILRHVFLYRPGEYLFDPAVYQGFSRLFFFPFLLLSFDFDLSVFGFRPVFFHLHQLGAIALAASLLYVVMRRWLGRPGSFAAGLLFLVGAPLARVVPQLGVRHYVDGLVFALAAVLCFLEALDRRGWWWSLSAGVLFLCAIACKEVYAPLPLLLVAIPEGRFARRLQKAIPLFVAAAAGTVWRQSLLTGYVGGYSGDAPRTADVPRLALRLLAQSGDAVFGAHTRVGLALLAVVVAGFLIPAIRRRRPLLLALWCSALLLGPLVPVADSFQSRYGLVPWAAAAAGIGWAADAWSRRRAGAAAGACLVLAAGLLSFPANRETWGQVVSSALRSRAEALFFFHESVPGDVLRLPVEEGNFYTWLAWLRTEAVHGGRPGRAVLDDLYFCSDGAAATKVFGFSQRSSRVEEVAGGARAVCEAYSRRTHESAPLSVRIAGERGIFAWEFGPWASGGWAILIGEDLIRYDLPGAGRHKPVFLPNDTTLVLRYESPEGWLAFSPPLPFHVVNGSTTLSWSR